MWSVGQGGPKRRMAFGSGVQMKWMDQSKGMSYRERFCDGEKCKARVERLEHSVPVEADEIDKACGPGKVLMFTLREMGSLGKICCHRQGMRKAWWRLSLG